MVITEDLIGESSLLKQLTNRLLEKAKQTGIADHLGFEKHAPKGKKQWQFQEQWIQKTITGDFGNLDITTPRNRIQYLNRSSSLEVKPALPDLMAK